MLFALVGDALSRWREFGEAVKLFEYPDAQGTTRSLDLHLPPDAFATASTGGELEAIKTRYEIPLAARQAGTLQFPPEVSAAFDSIFDLFRLYACGEPLDEWALAERALQARPIETQEARLTEAIKRVRS